MGRIRKPTSGAEPKYVRWCNVYFELAGGRAIVATCFNHAGLLAEVPDGSVVVPCQAGVVGVSENSDLTWASGNVSDMTSIPVIAAPSSHPSTPGRASVPIDRQPV